MHPGERSEADPSATPPSTPPSKRRILGGIALGILVVAALAWAGFALAPHFTRERIESLVRGAGPWGPIVLLGLQAGQILAAPIPGIFVPILAGLLYGPFWGSLITMAGSCVGSVGAYWIGRSGGRSIAKRLIGEAPLEKAHRLIGGRRWVALIPLFLIPFSPADSLCFVAGIVGMEWKRFWVAVILGRLPKDAVVAAGAALGWGALRF